MSVDFYGLISQIILSCAHSAYHRVYGSYIPGYRVVSTPSGKVYPEIVSDPKLKIEFVNLVYEELMKLGLSVRKSIRSVRLRLSNRISNTAATYMLGIRYTDLDIYCSVATPDSELIRTILEHSYEVEISLRGFYVTKAKELKFSIILKVLNQEFKYPSTRQEYLAFLAGLIDGDFKAVEASCDKIMISISAHRNSPRSRHKYEFIRSVLEKGFPDRIFCYDEEIKVVLDVKEVFDLLKFIRVSRRRDKILLTVLKVVGAVKIRQSSLNEVCIVGDCGVLKIVDLGNVVELVFNGNVLRLRKYVSHVKDGREYVRFYTYGKKDLLLNWINILKRFGIECRLYDRIRTCELRVNLRSYFNSK